MASIGFATLDVIPSLQGAQASIEKQASGPLANAGKSGGKKYGTAAGASAGTSFSSKFAVGLKKTLPALTAVSALGFSLFKGFERLDAIDQARAKLRGLGSDAKEVDTIMASALASVKGTAFGLGDAATIAASAAAAGVAPGKELTTYLTLVADSAAIANTNLADMGQILNNVQTLGAAYNDSLQSLAHKGIPVYSLLSSELGVSTAAVKKLATQGKISGDILNKVLTEKIGGSAQKAGETFTGALANMKAAVGRIGANLLEGVFPKAQGGLVSLTDSLGKVESAATVAGTGLGKLVTFVAGLPGPVKTAAAAFVALKTAAAFGIGTKLLAGVSALTRGLDSLRLRGMLAADAFRAQRLAADGAAAGNGRLGASFAAIRAGAAGAGLAIKGFLVAALPIAAITAGIAIYSKFAEAQAKTKEGQEKAKAAAEELTATLNEQTGAITKNTTAAVRKGLLDSGALQAAKDLGINLPLVTKAALGNKDAFDLVSKAVQRSRIEYDKVGLPGKRITDQSFKQDRAARTLAAGLGLQSDAVSTGKGNWDLLNDAKAKSIKADRKSAKATRRARDAMGTYATETGKAKDALKKLLGVEEKRRLAALKNRQDRLALEEVLASAQKRGRQVGRHDKQSIDPETVPGQKNLAELYSLAEQFNNSSARVKNNQYVRIRTQFIALADQLGYTAKGAENLATKLLNVPKTAPVKFQSKGYREILAQIKELKRARAALTGPILTSPGTNKPTAPLPGSTEEGRPGVVFNYNAPVTYTDEKAGRRRAERQHRRAASDGVRRP